MDPEALWEKLDHLGCTNGVPAPEELAQHLTKGIISPVPRGLVCQLTTALAKDAKEVPPAISNNKSFQAELSACLDALGFSSCPGASKLVQTCDILDFFATELQLARMLLKRTEADSRSNTAAGPLVSGLSEIGQMVGVSQGAPAELAHEISTKLKGSAQSAPLVPRGSLSPQQWVRWG
eukprot:TRINITY_DN8594_c0_g1_i3.p1 TRINITY_DN8594_c0_g1~~TRINITY_DN8594_c0_g1_i3.p1  ORF type:complete len:179 (+),score=35.77 TRINITY_DN8594_c0_g1_i3:137-673(+)